MDAVLLIGHVVHRDGAVSVVVLLGKDPVIERRRRIVGAQAAIGTIAGALLAVLAGQGHQHGRGMPQHIGVGVLVGAAQADVDDGRSVVGIAVGQIHDCLLIDARGLGGPFEGEGVEPFLYERELSDQVLAVHRPLAFERRNRIGAVVENGSAGHRIPHHRSARRDWAP